MEGFLSSTFKREKGILKITYNPAANGGIEQADVIPSENCCDNYKPAQTSELHLRKILCSSMEVGSTKYTLTRKCSRMADLIRVEKKIAARILLTKRDEENVITATFINPTLESEGVNNKRWTFIDQEKDVACDITIYKKLITKNCVIKMYESLQKPLSEFEERFRPANFIAAFHGPDKFCMKSKSYAYVVSTVGEITLISYGAENVTECGEITWCLLDIAFRKGSSYYRTTEQSVIAVKTALRGVVVLRGGLELASKIAESDVPEIKINLLGFLVAGVQMTATNCERQVKTRAITELKNIAASIKKHYCCFD